MTQFTYSLRLTSDAEPATGLGGEVVNGLVPRDEDRKPLFPASHLKGLMRMQIQEIAHSLGWPAELELRTFGGHGLGEDESHVGAEAVFSMTAARAVAEAPVIMVTRTAIDPTTGAAKDGALRTTEAVAVGAVFQGEIHTSLPQDSAEDLAWRLALLSIRAVGGNRNRGSGECVVEIEGETRSPGELLTLISQRLQQSDWQDAVVTRRIRRETAPAPAAALSGSAVCLRLDFQATTAICCPQLPDGANVIATGFSIPASAVQGAILTGVNESDPALASALFASPQFRAWPLLPCRRLEDSPPASADSPVPIFVSLTHRTAKFSLDKCFRAEHFVDEAIQKYDWKTVPDGAPLKASDGVLLRESDGRVGLWKAGDMPHAITAHGVPSENPDDRQLFTVDAMSPMHWRGLLVLPEAAAARVCELFAAEPVVSFGKSRSVQGLGRLTATILDGDPAEWTTRTDNTVLVVQSPLLLPDRSEADRTAEAEFKELARRWTEQHQLGVPIENVWANVGIRFGWNRHQCGRQQACRVVLPGSVIAFAGRVDSAALGRALIAGIGLDGRERGYGAASVHPGTAVEMYQASPSIRTVQRTAKDDFPGAMRLVLEMQKAAARLPSPSQIRAVQQCLEKSGPQPALDYLKTQTGERTARIWFTWEAILDRMKQLMQNYDSETASRALAVLANLAIVVQRGDSKS